MADNDNKTTYINTYLLKNKRMVNKKNLRLLFVYAKSVKIMSGGFEYLWTYINNGK